MNIALVNEFFPPFVTGGAELFLEALAGYLSSRGHRIVVITSKQNGEGDAERKFIDLPARGITRWKSIKKSATRSGRITQNWQLDESAVMKRMQPPKLLAFLLEHLIPEDDRESLPGDFAEAYETICATRTALAARIWYVFQIMKLSPIYLFINLRWSITMLQNYLKIGLRNIKKNPGYALINICGLAIGMACCLLLLLWVQDELSYDRYFTHADRLYRVIDYETYSNGEQVVFSMNPASLAQTLRDNYPEITAV